MQLLVCGFAWGDAYVATSVEPVRMILAELVGPEHARGTLPRSASPHTYDPRVADAITASDALALFYVDPIFDGWAARLPARERVALLPHLPHVLDNEAHAHDGHAHGHDHGPVDPHFWSDPLTVQGLVPPLTEELVRLFPDDADAIRERSAAFLKSLTQLDAEINQRFMALRGKRVIVGHSSWMYFLRRYGVEVVAVIEATPGQEMSLARFAALSRDLGATGADAIIAEPQHGMQTAETLARETGIPMCTIDPLWAGDGSYADLIRENAKRIAEVLE